MMKTICMFALVGTALAAPTSSDSVQSNTDQTESWTETSSVRSVSTIRQSNQSNAVVPQSCAAGCPCCSPKIDIKASVVESYKRHRAQVAMIGDYGSCSVKYQGCRMLWCHSLALLDVRAARPRSISKP